MGKSKQRRDHEQYEDYWKITAQWTDVYGQKFFNALRIIINYIDANKAALQELDDGFEDSELYDRLQVKLVEAFDFQGDIEDAKITARKGINQFVKLGFVYPMLKGYHPLAKKFINTTDKEEKQILFSKIFYESSSFASGVTVDNRRLNHMGFLLRTLDKNKELSENDIQALMYTDIDLYPNGYMTREELDSQFRASEADDFINRKYNQKSHLISFLKRFIDLKVSKNPTKIYFADDPDIVDDEYEGKYHCDPIKLRIHRQELLDESIRIYGEAVCYLEKKPYKGLRDSHIKAKQECVDEGNEEQAYDVNNALLLSPNTDQYFDKHDISFEDDGSIMIGKNVDPSVRVEFERMSLDKEVLTEDRKRFLEYHRRLFQIKNGES